ncbi:RNA-binding protein [Trypanosoma rangeli SC58]|uniref:RNA-binding protein n=1 Tax=Trypanosoma rangeli SC58 TaxID=429131 RepID=A0A061J2I2_TRYRA|nr:RNA-binding protein [Trypanosoma rangeli SC58]
MYSQQFPQNGLYGTPNMMPYQGVMQPPIPPQGTAPGMLSNYNSSNRGGYDAPQANRNMGQRQPSRQRNNEIGEVSRVIHMRNITPNVTQLSIQNLVQNFGNIKHIVMLRQMNQALVEMESTKSAQQLVDFFRQTGYAEIDGRRVYIRYSNHQSLTATQHTSKTLLVSMFNTQYDVSAAAQITPMIVYQIFGNYGSVQKIVVLPKNESSHRNHNRVQALVQFDSKATAENVKSICKVNP